MKIKLNRKVCDCWEAACEQCFGANFLGDEVKPTACLVEVVDDDSQDVVFLIEDRDGADKAFVVNDQNFADTIDSWMGAYQEQIEAKKKAKESQD